MKKDNTEAKFLSIKNDYKYDPTIQFPKITEQKLFLKLLLEVQRNHTDGSSVDGDKNKIIIQKKELEGIISKSRGTVYRELKSFAQKLLESSFLFWDDEKESFEGINLVHKASYSNGLFTANITESFLNDLILPTFEKTNFFKLYSREIASFNNSYTLRFLNYFRSLCYENNSFTKNISFIDLKRKMNIPDDKSWKVFRQNVLNGKKNNAGGRSKGVLEEIRELEDFKKLEYKYNSKKDVVTFFIERGKLTKLGATREMDVVKPKVKEEVIDTEVVSSEFVKDANKDFVDFEEIK